MTFFGQSIPLIPTLVAIAVIAFVLIYSIKKTNKYTTNKFNYVVFDARHTLFMLIPFVLFIATLYIANNGNSIFANTMQERDINVITMGIACVFLIMGRVIFVWKKTNLVVSLFSTSILLIAAPFVFALLLLTVIATTDQLKKNLKN